MNCKYLILLSYLQRPRSQATLQQRLYLRAVCAAAALLAATTLHAQNYPQRALRAVVPFAPGGHTDIVARALCQKFAEAMAQPCVVENRAGAGGIIGAEAVAKATPDGHTLLVMPLPFAVLPSLHAKLPYDAARDFAAVSVVTSAPLLLFTHPSVPAQNAAALIRLARAQPGNLRYGSAGPGSTAHLATEYFSLLAGVKMTHVPYKGGVPALADLLAGQISLLLENMPLAMPYIKPGRVRALAVSDLRRAPLLPEVPTLDESGLRGFQVIGWNAVFVPGATPRAAVERLHTETARALATADVKQRLAALGVEGVGNTPEQATAFVRAETAKWGKVVRESGMKAE